MNNRAPRYLGGIDALVMGVCPSGGGTVLASISPHEKQEPSYLSRESARVGKFKK